MGLGSINNADDRGFADWKSVHGIGPTPTLATTDDTSPPPPLICFSHLRWDFVTQRPQHLMKRFAQSQSVFVWEEHIPCDHPLPFLEHHPFPADNVIALRPRLPHWWNAEQVEAGLRQLLDMLVATSIRTKPVLWFYTPMMLPFAEHLDAAAIVYDCMDELSAFRFADPALLDREARLLERADLVFTGGYSLYEAKRGRHRDVHAFPSAVDVAHFAQARTGNIEPEDQRHIPGPKLGFFGVIDERIDLALLDAVAARRPDWSFVMIGPVVKIDPAHLPRRANIHWLGGRGYNELPAYLSGWDVALMPFAINAATRFISPTKTPEYLAGGLPVVSTPIVDVIRHYGDAAAVTIAADATAFVTACEAALALPREGAWRDEADRLLATQSWDRTQTAMATEIDRILQAKRTFRPAPKRERYDTLIVGAGFAGAVLAERLANDSGQRVLVVDRRPHIGGNAYDEHDAAGVLIHRYGPHIFHTNSKDVFDYLSRFTDWRPYEHRVLASVDDKLVPMPINRTTLNELYGLSLKNDAEAAAFLASRAESVEDIRTSEDVVVAAVGRDLYETFFRGYTRKQWGLDPSELDRAVTARVPTRTSTDDRYFTDKFQAMPANGYTRMFEAMLDHPGITLDLGVEYRDVIDRIDVDHIVFTGPIDEYFDFRFGKLPYRSLQFRHETHDVAQFQPVAVVNYPDETVPQTRITEYKHLTGQLHAKTSISYEFPSAEGDPYYPIPRPENQALFKRYEALADAEDGVTFVGRLATYRYYNMDQVVGQALVTYRRMVAKSAVLETPVMAAE
ncbi:UDP-galactopyranose mutase [Sphingomonas sp. PP-CC-3G-468]|nr:UDP-galactopyranose mutase [Sphingomonas sp. PP-CC-1A-547]RKE45700.1 UDP-galactopyranose mutase [Sphingomonas sp. PP-CC-1A-547]TCM06649.1 UDP-galactopyranose mutase [Sphingomonas sp. PP-CC-3G-468]